MDFFTNNVLPVIGVVGFYAIVPIIIWETIVFIRLIKKYGIHEFNETGSQAIRLIALLYALGATAKFGHIGPELLRFYVADIGFPVFIGLIFIKMILGSANERLTVKAVTETMELRKKSIYVFAGAFVICVGYEVSAGFLVSEFTKRGLVSYGVGAFDWFDVLAYAVGATFAILVLLWQIKIGKIYAFVLREIESKEELERSAEAAREREARHAQRVNATRRKKVKRR